MNTFLRILTTSALLAALAACGGSSNDDPTQATGAGSTDTGDGLGVNTGGSGGSGSTGTGTGSAGTGDGAGTNTGGSGSTGSNGTNSGAPTSNILPRIYIATEGGAAVLNTDDYLNATVRILSDTGTELLQAPTEIRGRGNTTWGMPKKPYRLKFEQASSVLGMPAERDWALLANYADKSLVRGKLATEIGEQVGFDYTPRSRFVELYFNDEY